ncbi:MAG: 2-amino-4-hydroxy-6-hydroxymethyldihydropteridine diphosphokinase [Chloroflexota bacterium]
MNRVVILVGSNINKEVNLPAAVRLLAEQTRLIAVSSVYETIPMGFRDQPNFFNAAVLIETNHSALALKERVLAPIEQELQRVRTNNKNGARTIDLDIGLFNDRAFTYGHPGGKVRRVPDKDLLRFPHAAIPVAELLPEMPHPETGERFVEIAERLEKTSREGGKPILWKREDIRLDTVPIVA